MRSSLYEPKVPLSRTHESDLLKKVKRGQNEAFEELERRYRPKIAHQLRRLCHNESEAEDILQDVLMTLYLKLNTFEGKSRLSTWIYRITLNAFLMHRRKQRSRQLLFSNDDAFEFHMETSGPYSEGDREAYSTIANNEFEMSLAQALSELPKGYRQVFLMRNKDELSIKEVSKLMGISIPAVKSRNRRARELLKSRLEDYYHN